MTVDWEWLRLLLANRGLLDELPSGPVVVRREIVDKMVRELLTVSAREDIFSCVLVLRAFGKPAAVPLLNAIRAIDINPQAVFLECQARLAFALSNLQPIPIDELIAALKDKNAAINNLAEKALRDIAEARLQWDEPKEFFKDIRNESKKGRV